MKRSIRTARALGTLCLALVFATAAHAVNLPKQQRAAQRGRARVCGGGARVHVAALSR